MRYWAVRPPPECGWSGKKKQKGKGFCNEYIKKDAACTRLYSL